MSDTVEKALRLAKSINAEGKSSGGGAWTRKEGKNPEGGLNEKGRASLRAQGHDIKRPQPEGGSRRDSFCARMKGMKAKLTSKETANDPDSRINKSLRKWNCADGGKVWDKPRPDDLGKPKHLSSAKKAKAKAMAKAAGRPYPNLVDNMRAAKADGGQVGKAMRMIGRMSREDGGFNPNDYNTLQNAGLDVRGPNEAADLAASYASMQGPQSDDAQIRNYEEGMREFQRMTPEQQQMSHAEAVPMRPVSINAPALGGVKHIGDAPYNVAEPLSTMAQTAYGMKTMPLYQTPLAPVARAIDAYETAQELRKNPSLGTAASHAMSTLWPVGGKAGAALAGAAAGAGLMGQESAEASPADIARIAANAGKQTVRGPLRNMYPAIYGNPRELAAEAASRVAPESPALKRLFGVTRPEMYEIAGNRAGNAEPVLAFKANPRGNVAAQSIMVPENEKRLQDLLVEGQKQKGLREGMMPWYYMDPAYKRLEELVGPEEAKKQFHQLNTSMGTMSPNSTVNAEIARGTSAHYMANQGRFSDFDKYGGNPRQAPPDVAKMLEGMPGHKVHSTSQIGPLRKFMETGEHGMQSPKAPLYIQSSSVPELGFQTKLPVPDAHYTRLLGLPDVRGGTRDLGASMVMPEYQSTGDWFRNKIAEPVGMQAVPAQALMWGAGSGASGVKTAVGSPKLEMLADHIMSVAKRNNIAPELARDLVLQGKMRKRGGKVDAALRLADQRIASASGGKSPPQKVPNLYENLDKFYKEETGQIQPKHLERDWRYNILPEEYRRGNLGSGQYAMANGGTVERHGYADGGQPGQAQGQFNPGSYISNVYNQFANRAPNQSETNFWQGQMNQGSTPQQVYQGIANDAGTQAGYYGQYNAADPNSFNTMLNSTYQSYLGRAPNASDTAFWQGQLAQGSTPQQIVQGIANDQAARNYAAQQMAAWGASGNVAPQAAAPAQQAAPQSVSNTGVIGAAYNQYLGRAPTQDEVNFWQGELNKGVSPQQIMQGISSDASVRQSYANQYNPANQSTFNNLLNSTYQAYLGRAPNESDIAFWQGELNKGVSPQQIVSGIANDQASKNFLASQASQYGPVSSAAAPSSAPAAQSSFGKSDPETSDAISAIYNQYMGRSPTSDEVNYWSNELAKGKSFADFSNVVSNDLSSKNYANNQFIIDEYQGLLGRDPNSDELNYWQGQLNKGSSRAQIDAAISSDPGSQAYQASNFAPYQVASSSGNSGISSGPRTAEQANASVPRSSQELQNHFGPLEQAYGLPTGALMAMGGIESTYGTNQHRAGSQYKGMMQLGNDIVKKYNVKNVYDWRQNSDAAAQYMRDNAKEFVDKTGTQPQIGDFYGMHQQGATGWSNMVSKPNDLAYKTVGLQKVLQNVPAELASKAKSLTNAQFREFFNGKIEQGLSGPDGKGRDVLFGGASSAPPAPPPMIPTGVGESGTGGIFPSGGIAGLDSSLSGFTPISGSGGVDYTAPATPMASYTPPAAPVAPSISHTPSVSHTGGGGSHTVSHGSGSVSFAPPASSGGGSGTIDPYFGHAGSTHYDPRYGNGVGGGADWEWDYAKKRGGKISDKKDMKVYSRPAGGSHNRGAKAVKDALRLARK